MKASMTDRKMSQFLLYIFLQRLGSFCPSSVQPRVFSNAWCRERLLLWQRKLRTLQLLSSKQFQTIRALSFGNSKASAPVNFMDLVKDFNEGLG